MSNKSKGKLQFMLFVASLFFASVGVTSPSQLKVQSEGTNGACLRAKPSAKTYKVARVPKTEIRIDGRLDEPE